MSASLRDREDRIALLSNWIGEGKTYEECVRTLQVLKVPSSVSTALDIAFDRAGKRYTERVYGVLRENGFSRDHGYVRLRDIVIQVNIYNTSDSFKFTIQAKPDRRNGLSMETVYTKEVTDSGIVSLAMNLIARVNEKFPV